MSVGRRIVSGAVASWVGILLGFCQRLIAVPVILSKWDASRFGTYLALMAAVGLFSLPGRAFETVVGRECLRLGANRPGELVGIFGGGLFVSLGIELTMLLLVILLLSGGAGASLAVSGLHTADFLLVAMAMFIARSFVSFPGAVFSQVLSCYGYYPRLTWLGLVGQILAIIAPILAVMLGSGPAGVAAAEILAPAFFAPFAWYWLRHWARQHEIWRWLPDVGVAVRLWRLSLQNLLIYGLEMLRQEGTRLLLAPLAGMAALTTFATIRTGANVALQGLSTITNPVRPELMRFLGQRDQARSEGTFGLIWMVVVALLTPAVVILQAMIAPFFAVWTRGVIHFDPVLFALLSLSVLVYAVAQPALVVITGNNLLKSQLVLAATAGGIVIGGMFLLVPRIGIVGAGVSLLAAELTVTTGYRIVARRWLRRHGLEWPSRQAGIANVSVWIAAAALGGMAFYPEGRWPMLVVSLVLLGWNLWRYWHALPPLATDRAKSMLMSLSLFRWFRGA